jgi:predicted choloylglycine hydrolase
MLTTQENCFQIVTWTGTYADIGYKAGLAMRGVEYPYLTNLFENFDFPVANANYLRDIVGILTDFCPQVLESMVGFAEGAGIPEQKVLTAFSGYGFDPPIFGGCSVLAVLPERTGSGVITARNYDFSSDPRFSESRLTLLYPTDGVATISTGEFVFGRLEGINEHGVFVGISYAHGMGSDKKGLFFPIIVRAALENATSMQEAQQVITSIPHSSTYNFLVADQNSALLIEAGPGKTVLREPENGLLFATNHYVSQTMAQQQKRLMKNSLTRYETIKNRLSDNHLINVEQIRCLMSGHGTQGVCMHSYRAMLGTLWSGIFDLTTQNVEYCAGPPCNNPWLKIPFAKKPILQRQMHMNLQKNNGER